MEPLIIKALLEGDTRKKVKRIIKPIEAKESMRWIESYRLKDKIAIRYKEKLFINIADREWDFYEFLSEYKPLESTIETKHL